MQSDVWVCALYTWRFPITWQSLLWEQNLGGGMPRRVEICIVTAKFTSFFFPGHTALLILSTIVISFSSENLWQSKMFEELEANSPLSVGLFKYKTFMHIFWTVKHRWLCGALISERHDFMLQHRPAECSHECNVQDSSQACPHSLLQMPTLSIWMNSSTMPEKPPFLKQHPCWMDGCETVFSCWWTLSEKSWFSNLSGVYFKSSLQSWNYPR